jgi:hypothetical protein
MKVIFNDTRVHESDSPPGKRPNPGFMARLAGLARKQGITFRRLGRGHEEPDSLSE